MHGQSLEESTYMKKPEPPAYSIRMNIQTDAQRKAIDTKWKNVVAWINPIQAPYTLECHPVAAKAIVEQMKRMGHRVTPRQIRVMRKRATL